MKDVVIGKAAAFPDPGRKVVEVDGTEVGVFCRNGKFTAFENVCPHMGGPVCQGKIIPRVQELVAGDKTSLGFTFSRLRRTSPVRGTDMNSTSAPASIRDTRVCGYGR